MPCNDIDNLVQEVVGAFFWFYSDCCYPRIRIKDYEEYQIQKENKKKNPKKQGIPKPD